VPPDDAQDNFTDPESRIMKTSAGYDQCYNGQLALDEASLLIVATGLAHCAADNAALLPLVDQAHATLGAHPHHGLADAGYRGEATFQALKARAITAYISLGHETRPAKPPNPAPGATQRIADRLASVAGRARDRRRKAIVEPVLGWIKAVLGFQRFSLRGEAKARGEWTVVCLAVNLKRLHRLTLASGETAPRRATRPWARSDCPQTPRAVPASPNRVLGRTDTNGRGILGAAAFVLNRCRADSETNPIIAGHAPATTTTCYWTDTGIAAA